MTSVSVITDHYLIGKHDMTSAEFCGDQEVVEIPILLYEDGI